MPAPITLLSIDAQLQAKLHQRYEETTDAETRTRYQMIVLAQQGHRVPQIARMVLRSEDTVARVLKRFGAVGLDAIPRRTSPGRERSVTAARARRVDPGHRSGSSRGQSANRQLDDRVAGQVPGSVDRDYRHPRDGARVLACPWVCLQATDVDLATQSRRESRLRGKRLRVEVVLAGATASEPLPVEPLVEADL